MFLRDQLVGGSARDWKKHQMKLFFTVKFNFHLFDTHFYDVNLPVHLLDQTKQSTTSQINFRLIGSKSFHLVRLLQLQCKLTNTASFDPVGQKAYCNNNQF